MLILLDAFFLAGCPGRGGSSSVSGLRGTNLKESRCNGLMHRELHDSHNNEDQKKENLLFTNI